MMKRLIATLALLALFVPAASVWADEYDDTIKVFRKAGESGRYFQNAYGYAVFPTIGKGGEGIGGAYGEGHVYEKGKYIGNATMTQVTIGFQLGGQAYSEIIFFRDQAALKDFTSGNFEFGAEASAVAITAGAGATASTTGTSAGASLQQKQAATVAEGYTRGMATFTIAKGGLMYAATIGGQKFKYTPR